MGHITYFTFIKWYYFTLCANTLRNPHVISPNNRADYKATENEPSSEDVLGKNCLFPPLIENVYMKYTRPWNTRLLTIVTGAFKPVIASFNLIFMGKKKERAAGAARRGRQRPIPQRKASEPLSRCERAEKPLPQEPQP